MTFLLENAYPVHNLHSAHGKGGHARLRQTVLHPLLYQLMYP